MRSHFPPMITGLEKFGESGVFVTTLADNEKRGGLCDRGSVLYFFFQLCWHSGTVNNSVGMNQAQNANQRLAAVLPAVEHLPGYRAT